MLLPFQGERNIIGHIIPQGDALGYVQTLPFQGASGILFISLVAFCKSSDNFSLFQNIFINISVFFRNLFRPIF
jgi:hypothetical protein